MISRDDDAGDGDGQSDESSGEGRASERSVAASRGSRGVRRVGGDSADSPPSQSSPQGKDGEEKLAAAVRSGNAWKSKSARPERVQPVSATRVDDDVEEEPENPASLKSSTEIEGTGTKVQRGEVAATINGRPIFVDDVLFRDPRLRAYFAQAKEQISPEQYAELRNHAIKQRIQPLIEQELLLQALRTQLKDEQLDGIKKHIDTMFETEQLPKLMKAAKVATRGEFEMKLRQTDTSLEALRTEFRNHQLAQQFLSSRTMPRDGFDRKDLLRHYQDNQDKFAIAGRVKWQQIHLSHAKHKGSRGAKKLADQIVARLEQGEEFEKLAREFSDGPTAAQGGYQDWTTQHSLKSDELDEALFEMPIGEEFARIDGPDAIDIVVVLDRQEAGVKSFASVQADIRNELRNSEFRRSVQDLLAELAEKATIEKFYQ